MITPEFMAIAPTIAVTILMIVFFGIGMLIEKWKFEKFRKGLKEIKCR
jgi:hypothetical protein